MNESNYKVIFGIGPVVGRYKETVNCERHIWNCEYYYNETVRMNKYGISVNGDYSMALINDLDVEFGILYYHMENWENDLGGLQLTAGFCYRLSK